MLIVVSFEASQANELRAAEIRLEWGTGTCGNHVSVKVLSITFLLALEAVLCSSKR